METAFGNPDPETWRVFRLEVEKQEQSGAIEVTLLRPADWLVEQQQSTALLALLAELQVSQATAPPPATADFVSFVVQSPSLSIFQRGPEQVLASLDHVLAAAPKAGRLGAQGLTFGALDIARGWLASSLVEGVEDDLAWQDQVAAVLDGSAAGSLIWLEMPELGAVGLATVKSIEPCPPIKSGPGRIVTATFRHASAEVLDLTFAPNLPSSSSLAAHTSTRTTDPSPLTLGVTAAHPFWSVDRESFVPAGELRPQEQVIAIDGQHFRLTSITPRAGPETVYNLEVALDHVYYVGQGGVLVHNSCTGLSDTLVYLLKRGDNVVYVGITKQLPELRKAQHLLDKRGMFDDIVPITDRLTHDQARNLERGILDAIVRAAGSGGERTVREQLKKAGLLNKNGGRTMKRVIKNGNINWSLIDPDLLGDLLNGIIRQ